MKKLTLVVLPLLLIQIEGYLIKVPTSPTNNRIAPVGWVHIQKSLLPLFENVCEASTDPIIVRLSEEFKLDPTIGNYLKPEVIDNLLNLKGTKGLLARGIIFTEYDSDHLNELKTVYEVLYYARDFDTFYKAACWARQYLNCGLFIDAIYLAVITRRDTEKVSVPPPYEVLPNYFIRRDFILKASSLVRGEDVATDSIRNEGTAYILDVNYTTNFYEDSDDNLAYFHEDIGLNSYYFLTKLKKVPWLNDIRNRQSINGEYIYHTMKQLMARYNLERYSNGLPELEGIDWDYIYDLPFDPMLVYSNGNSFSEGISFKDNNETVTLLRNIESNLSTVVIHMRDNGYNKSEILNYLMDILVTNEKSYENLAIQIFSNNNTGSPSILEHYITSVRDPIFWRLNKKIVDMVDKALSVLPSYTRNQLYFPGVNVQNIEVKKVMTLFDNFEFDVTDALKTEGEEPKFQIKISQRRLNHKPFAFKINISSLVAQKAFVKIYIGPKVMPSELTEKKNLFMLLDCFEANFKIGSNILSRTSNEITSLSEDLVSLGTVHKNVLDSEFGIDALPLKSVSSQIRFPSRLIFPKGTSSGLPLQLFVFVAPYVKASVGGSKTKIDLNLVAFNSPGYPLDLNLELQELFNLPNAFVKDIIITHKTESTGTYKKPINTYNEEFNDKVGPTNEIEYGSPNDLLALDNPPAFTKKKFDYISKKSQFGKLPNYSYKGIDNYNTIKKIKPSEQNKETDDSTTVRVDYLTESTDINNNIYITPRMDHKFDKDINVKPINTFNVDFNDKVWPTNKIEYGSPNGLLGLANQPVFTKTSFDYKSKKNEFVNRSNYSYKRTHNYNKNKSSEQNKETNDSTTVKVDDLTENTEINNKNIYITPGMDHKFDKDINVKPSNTFNEDFKDKVWPTNEIEYGSTNDLLAFANPPALTRKSFDYKSKKTELGNRPNYSYKRTDKYNMIEPSNKNEESDDSTTINVHDLSENTEIVNIDVTPEIDHKFNNDVNENGYKFVFEKDIVNNVLHKEINEDLNIIPHKDSEVKNVAYKVIIDKDNINNIPHKKVNEDDNTQFNIVYKDNNDSNVYRVILDKDNEKYIVYKKINDLVSNLDKIIEKTNKVNPQGLLTMPRKRFSNMFNIIFKSQKPDDEMDERVYV